MGIQAGFSKGHAPGNSPKRSWLCAIGVHQAVFSEGVVLAPTDYDVIVQGDIVQRQGLQNAPGNADVGP